MRLAVGPVPVREIAYALDIVEIHEARTKSFEGALLTLPERDTGKIIVNSNASPRRRRFTIAHELLHFLNPRHKSTNHSAFFACGEGDLRVQLHSLKPEASRHLLQEAEANRFAIELLAPKSWMRPFLSSVPDLARVLGISKLLDISSEASARRYIELHGETAALVFSRNRIVRYFDKAQDFPYIARRKGDTLPPFALPADNSGLTSHDLADPLDWLARSPKQDLVVQTLHQRDGYAITLLVLEKSSDCE